MRFDPTLQSPLIVALKSLILNHKAYFILNIQAALELRSRAWLEELTCKKMIGTRTLNLRTTGLTMKVFSSLIVPRPVWAVT